MVTLFVAGVAYGVIVTRLHESRSIAPVELQLEAVLDRTSWLYLGFWGVAGVVLGSLLPFIDRALAAGNEDDDQACDIHSDKKHAMQNASENVDGQEPRITYLGAEWNPLVRSIGAFVGIAFAIVSHSLPLKSPLYQATNALLSLSAVSPGNQPCKSPSPSPS